MSQADELLMSLDEDVTETATGNLVVGADRFITVPDSLKKIAVQYDHDIETVTFDCPRYWDEHDLSKMRVYVNYMRADSVFGSHLCSNVVVDASDDSIMHFDWTISGHVTYVSGTITFLICVKNVDADGNEENIWHTEINSDMYVSTGMKCHDTILRRYPDIITQLLYRMDQSEAYIKGITVDAHVLATTDKATVEKTETENSINLSFGIPRGLTGNGIASVTRTSGNGAAGTTDIYTIRFTDGNSTTFGVYNGKNGEKGNKGDPGNTGTGIASIKLTNGNHSPGTLDTYTITFDNGTTTTFQVYNGANGSGSGDMMASVYDPQNKRQDIFAYVDTVDIDAGEW